MLGALAAALSDVALAVAPTKAQRWTAFANGRVAAGIHVVQTARGACVGASRVDARSDAWRCVAQGTTEDPCFAGPAALVICPFGTPASRDALELDLTGALPTGRAHRSAGPTPGDPWAVKTANGDYCYRATGTPLRIAGTTITYECAGAALLAGRPNRSGEVWTIEYFRNGGSTSALSMALQTVWW